MEAHFSGRRGKEYFYGFRRYLVKAKRIGREDKDMDKYSVSDSIKYVGVKDLDLDLFSVWLCEGSE